jgi:hypothetical protein
MVEAMVSPPISTGTPSRIWAIRSCRISAGVEAVCARAGAMPVAAIAAASAAPTSPGAVRRRGGETASL